MNSAFINFFDLAKTKYLSNNKMKIKLYIIKQLYTDFVLNKKELHFPKRQVSIIMFLH